MAEKTTAPKPGEAATAAHAVMPPVDLRYLAELARDASGMESFPIRTTGLGEGLPEEVPALWDPKNGRMIDAKPIIEAFRLRPERRAGTAHARTLASFIDLLNRHKDEHSAIFADTSWQQPSMTAVVDYHRTDREPRHGQHRIVYDFPLSEAWQAWLKMNGEVMAQGDFALFLEERIAELASPMDAERAEYERLFQTKFATPAELIGLSRGLQVRVGQNVKQAKVLQSGEAEIVFEETHTDAAGNRLIVPGLFMLSLPIFFEGAPVRMPVRLRYRAGAGGIRWFYQLYRADDWVTDRIRQDLALAAQKTGLPAYEGRPEA